MKILGATIGNCVHTAGILNFLHYAEGFGHKTVFLGMCLTPENLVAKIKAEKPAAVALSYRLTPEVAKRIFQELEQSLKKNKNAVRGVKFLFGGTESVCGVARTFKFFGFVISGNRDMKEIKEFLAGKNAGKTKQATYPQDLASRINHSYPYPLIRHHFGLPSLSATVAGARKIAEAQVLDILSIGPDQNAQEYFFNPGKMNPDRDGAGGVSVRKEADLKKIYQASRCGNYPLVRCYAGTNNLKKWAKMLSETINNAWGAIPIFWYSVLDGRSKRPLEKAIRENQETIRWHADQGIPVEINDSHQWGLRQAHDSLEAATAFLAAINAKKLGVKNYVFQYMFNTPPGISPAMDLAKMLAKKEMVESLVGRNFTVFTLVRAGIASFVSDPDLAKGQLASSILLSLALKPHIVHVVGFSEGDHAASAEEIIESCKIAHGVIKNSLVDWPEMVKNKKVQERKKEVRREASLILSAIEDLGAKLKKKDPLTNSEVLSLTVQTGILDAPHLKGSKFAKGFIETAIVNGKCCVVDPKTKRVISEKARIRELGRWSERSPWKILKKKKEKKS
ncbi:MAG: cobalamin B12-binding domain-containing protein [Candidatus Omnitrophica bacterium]|nr:cobalamin B12-binding domain-containing protein [Candidatus Omnitrophota bacterium]